MGNGNQSGVVELLKSLTGQANILTIPRLFIDLMGGDLEAALFLSQLIYWSDKGSTKDYFYKSFVEWEQELTLSYYKVNKATTQLEQSGILETWVQKIKGAPTVHYRVKMEALTAWIVEFIGSRVPPEEVPPPERKSRAKERKETKSRKQAEVEALQPTTEGGYLLFNLLGDEYQTLGRRPPTRFQSLAMKQRFEEHENRLGVSLEKAIRDGLSIPILQINKLISYVSKWGTGTKSGDRYSPSSFPGNSASVNPDYTSNLELAKEAARARLLEARKKTEREPESEAI